MGFISKNVVRPGRGGQTVTRVYKLQGSSVGNRIGYMPKSWWAAFFSFISGRR